MESVFLKLLNMSLTAGWLVLAIIVLRFLLQKAPKWVFCLLWGLAGLRLVIPFSLESAFSLVPSAEPVPGTILYEQAPAINSGIDILNQAVNPVLSDSFSPTVGASANPLQIITFAASILWMTGVAVMLIYFLASYLKLRSRVCTATLLEGNIRQSEQVGSPFILGLFKPQIYLPYHLEDNDFTYVIAHENAHLLRRDHLIKPIAFLILTLHWFNPLIWISYILLCRDIELACDERVIAALNEGERKSYSMALLSCNTNHRTVAACPLAFGELGVKERVIHVKKYKKPAPYIIIVAFIACILTALCFLTNPRAEGQVVTGAFGHSYYVESIEYCAPQYSFAYTTETAPMYTLTSDYELMVKGDILLGEDPEEWKLLGTMSETALTKDNFDAYFIPNGQGGWRGENIAEELRRETEKAWRLNVEENPNSILYYVIQQTNGDVYFAYGYNGSAYGDSAIRWLFKIAAAEGAVSSEGSAGAKESNATEEPDKYEEPDK